MKKMMVHSRSSVYNINYHIVWSVKYRKKLLTPEIEKAMQAWAQGSARKHGFTVSMFETGSMDHVHCFVPAPPDMPVSDIIKWLKGITAYRTFRYSPWVRRYLWGKAPLWDHSSYIETVGCVSGENIRRYISMQEKK